MYTFRFKIFILKNYSFFLDLTSTFLIRVKYKNLSQQNKIKTAENPDVSMRGT